MYCAFCKYNNLIRRFLYKYFNVTCKKGDKCPYGR